MATVVPATLLVVALASLAVACFRWRAGGKHHVHSLLIMSAVAVSMLLPAGSGKKTAAMAVAGGLMVVALMTTPGERIRRMRVELALFVAAIATIWALEFFRPPYASAMAGIALIAVLVLSAYGVMIARGNRERQA